MDTKSNKKDIILGEYTTFSFPFSTIPTRLHLSFSQQSDHLGFPPQEVLVPPLHHPISPSSFHIDFCHACCSTGKSFCEINIGNLKVIIQRNTSRKQQTLRNILASEDRWLTKMNHSFLLVDVNYATFIWP